MSKQQGLFEVVCSIPCLCGYKFFCIEEIFHIFTVNAVNAVFWNHVFVSTTISIIFSLLNVENGGMTNSGILAEEPIIDHVIGLIKSEVPLIILSYLIYDTMIIHH